MSSVLRQTPPVASRDPADRHEWKREFRALWSSPRAPVFMALGAALAWLPTYARPLSPDEGGFLHVAAQVG